jgi:hypothetical protein
MSDSSDLLRARIEALEGEVRRLALRVDGLEDAAGVRPVGAEAPLPGHSPRLIEDAPREAPSVIPQAPGIVALGGRTILALAGAYLVRALTDAGILSPLGGVALGLAYALLWYVQADRAGAKGEALSASFHGLAAGLIAYPLLWETSTQLGILAPPAALAALVGVFAAGSAVAARHRLAFVAWLGAYLALGTVAALLVETHEMLAAVLTLLVVAAIVEAFAFRELWLGMRWPTALVLDGAVLILVWLVGRQEGLPEGYPPVWPAAAVAAALALPGLYLPSIAARTLRPDHVAGPFDVLQAVAALAIGLGGAAHVVAAQGGSGFGLGLVATGLGALCYTVAFAFVERREGPGRNFYVYSSAGGLLTLLGSQAVFAPGGQAVLWCALGVAAIGLGRRLDRMTLRLHGTAYLWAAGLASGLVASVSQDLLGRARAGLPLPSLPGCLTAVAALGCFAVLARDDRVQGRGRIPHGLVAAFASWIVAGILVAVLVQPLDALGTVAAIATIRTGVLALLAVCLAEMARRFGLVELSWLVYPVLLLGGFKLLAEDVPAGRPAALFMSFGLYGIALILAPRLLRAKS